MLEVQLKCINAAILPYPEHECHPAALN
uniref:Uncharacterized protein n=1 Tax=Anguilla anguilla TaxID=7936 RepID=A0A0E9Q4B2_ANGAN